MGEQQFRYRPTKGGVDIQADLATRVNIGIKTASPGISRDCRYVWRPSGVIWTWKGGIISFVFEWLSELHW